MIEPVSGKEYPESLIRTAAKMSGISYEVLLEEISRGRVVLLEDGKMLRRGYTTGTCAAAASKAAALLLAGREAKEVAVTTPVGVTAVIAVERQDAAEACTACVRVDSGDYKGDTFNGMLICATARPSTEFSLKAGKGIGIIKKEGLGKVGAPDIYPHVLKNIEENVNEVLTGVELDLFVPEGEALAKDTVLPALGIEGGIPIFGSTGFVEPYTGGDYEHVIDFLIRDKNDVLGVTTGERSKRIAVEKLGFPEDKLVIAGNFVCYALEKSTAKKKVIFTMPAKLCDMLGIDAHDQFEFEFSSIGELVERLKRDDYERLKAFFSALAAELAHKTGADVYVFDNSEDLLGVCSADE